MRKEIVMYILCVLYVLCLISIFVMILTRMPSGVDAKKFFIKPRPATKDAIAIVNIAGPIRLSLSPKRFFDYDAEAIVKKLRNLGDRKDVKAIILRINSPGGSVAAVQEIYSEIIKLRKEKNKVVVASFGDVAASGGYYIASACDKIVANPGTLTGSIGVLLELGNVQELFKKIGVKVEIIKSGKHKDSGSMFRELTPEERKMFQELVQEAYNQFIEAIVQGRNMEKEKLLELADGRIYTGSQALSAGLVDKLGNDQTAIELAKEIAKISGEPRMISEYDPLEKMFTIFGRSEINMPLQEIINKNKMRFEYILE